MGLFDDIDPDSPRALTEAIAVAEGVLTDPEADSYDQALARTQRRAAEDKLGLQRLKSAAKRLGAKEQRDRPINLNDYGRLLENATALFDGSEEDGKLFLSNELLKHGIGDDLKGFSWDAFSAISSQIAELSAAAKKQRKRSSKTPEPQPEPRREPPKWDYNYFPRTWYQSLSKWCQNNGQDIEKIYAPTLHYQACRTWAEMNGFTSTDLFALIGPIQHKHGVPGGQVTFEVIDELESKLFQLINQRQKEKNMGLFDDVETEEHPQHGTVTIDTETGDVQQVAAPDTKEEELRDAARKALGLDKLELLEIKSERDLLFRLRQRAMIVLELGLIMQQYQEAKASLESQLKSWEYLFLERVRKWNENNPPPGGKQTRKTLYGDCSFRAHAESLCLKDDLDDTVRQGYLFQQQKSGKTADYDIKQLTRLECDLDKVKADYMKQLNQFKIDRATKPDAKMPEHPILQYKPAGKSFSVSPSLDKVKDLAKEQKWNREFYESTPTT